MNDYSPPQMASLALEVRQPNIHSVRDIDMRGKIEKDKIEPVDDADCLACLEWNGLNESIPKLNISLNSLFALATMNLDISLSQKFCHAGESEISCHR